MDTKRVVRVNEQDDDKSMQIEGDDADKTKGKTTTSRQSEKLYAAECMPNTGTKRAEKKRRKKANKANTTDDNMDDDYNFKVDMMVIIVARLLLRCLCLALGSMNHRNSLDKKNGTFKGTSRLMNLGDAACLLLMEK